MGFTEYGVPDAFFLEADGRSINEGFSGISITHGGSFNDPSDPPTHIWSFVAGNTQSPGIIRMTSICPYDTGSDPPDFVGEDYFCESAIEVDHATVTFMFAQLSTTFNFRNVLWDGEGCSAESECCSRFKHPYFVKQLEAG